MKLDPTDLRYLSGDEFRVLTAVEMGSKNHEVVPVSLIAQISGLRSGGVNKCIGELAKRNLVARVQHIKYDGYRLTYGGYDFLAMRTFAKRDTVYSVGNQIGTGKESDIYVVADEEGTPRCLKIHRLGRISFRTIKSKRDYLKKGQSASWMYMSRLAAMKEFAFMKILHEHGFPVPQPIDQARHCLVMELIDAFPLRQVAHVENPGALYSELMDLIVRLARSGLIHGDFNEFNILLREPKEDEAGPVPILIDFPQMVSTEHENAEYFFNRDVECIRSFFKKRYRYESSVWPRFLSTINENDGKKDFELDVMVAASGFGKKEGEALERYMKMIEFAEANEDDDDQEDDDAEEEEDEEDEDAGDDQEVDRGESAEDVPVDDEADAIGEKEAQREQNGRASGHQADSEIQSPGGDPSDEDATSAEVIAATSLLRVDESSTPDKEAPGRSTDTDASTSGAEDDQNSSPKDSETRAERQKRTAKARATQETPTLRRPRDVQAIVTSSLARNEQSRDRKHHGKKSIGAAGRAKGSKKKANPTTKIKESMEF